MKQIVHDKDPVVLVGGGQATLQDLHKALTLGDTCVAADGGARLAVAAGVDLAAVIGDFDSIPSDIKSQIAPNRQHLITEQDSTDFEKALSRITAPVVLGVGFTGGRMDHQLAVYHGLMRFADRPCVLLGESELLMLAPPKITLPLQAGDVVSLFPMGTVEGRSEGLRWPIDGIPFAPGSVIGTSNEATGPCTISVDAPAMLLILPLRIIQPVVTALMQPQAARWPVRG